MSEKVTITLKSPVEISGAKVSFLTMREPLVIDMRSVKRLKKEESDQEALLMANLCDVTEETINSLTLSDYKKVQEAFTGFFS